MDVAKQAGHVGHDSVQTTTQQKLVVVADVAVTFLSVFMSFLTCDLE